MDSDVDPYGSIQQKTRFIEIKDLEIDEPSGEILRVITEFDETNEPPFSKRSHNV